jgi:hypothetical protein
MEKDFDKEIDAILRGVAKKLNTAESPTNHLDADEISLFAEGLLPTNARSAAIEHFADCNNCRNVLVDVVSFREDTADTSSVNLAGAKPNFSESLRKLFSFPQLGFAMGALSILFVGIIGYVAVSNFNQSDNQMAKAVNPSNIVSPTVADKRSKEASETESSPIAVTNSAANSAPTNAAASAANIPLGMPKKSIDTNAADRSPKTGIEASKGPNVEMENAPPTLEQDSKMDKSISNEEKSVAREPAKPESLKTSPAPTVENPTTRDTYSESEVTPSALAKPKRNSAPAADVTANSSVSKSKSIGGKSFNNANGTWIDSAYKGGTTKTVNRGTKSFDDLDSGLKSIANSFTEPVIIVWKANNYRIQ